MQSKVSSFDVHCTSARDVNDAQLHVSHKAKRRLPVKRFIVHASNSLLSLTGERLHGYYTNEQSFDFHIVNRNAANKCHICLPGLSNEPTVQLEIEFCDSGDHAYAMEKAGVQGT